METNKLRLFNLWCPIPKSKCLYLSKWQVFRHQPLWESFRWLVSFWFSEQIIPRGVSHFEKCCCLFLRLGAWKSNRKTSILVQAPMFSTPTRTQAIPKCERGQFVFSSLTPSANKTHWSSFRRVAPSHSQLTNRYQFGLNSSCFPATFPACRCRRLAFASAAV